ncbi:cyclic nucleotide-binding domain-containing protein [Lujinxingia vulgaris]|uniref:Cyclic nucleotide-binding domain-containing protein n=1 Tax=Lujinxingia vulgaris TaxID=2600176 RepID=A0A5C6XGL2_9DELT|nr:cyclic nucleotide-binding domain-containing protein [Lujinxingia vulgaris]TXD38573.1 cyclic nucleotide-binding domain-containing protein [Lujinxingia vulgaris]
MVQIRLLDLLNTIDDAVESQEHARALQLILANWYNLPDPSPLRERTAVILATVGRKREAVEVYTLAARHYANAGFPTRAIAAIKQMHALNPASTELLDHFATLYSVRSPYLENGRPQPSFPQPAGNLSTQVHGAEPDLDELFERVLERATDPDGTAERPGSLPALPLLSVLPPDALRRVLDFVDYEIFPDAQIVFEPSQKSADLIWTVSNDLAVSDGPKTFRIPAGSLLGLNAFGGSERAPRYRVLSERGSECLRLAQSAIGKLNDELPDFLNRLATLRRHTLTEGLLDRHELFTHLSPDERARVVGRFTGLTLDSGTLCVRQGRPSPGLFILLDGKVDIVRKDDDWEITVATLSTGEVVGEVGLVASDQATATVVCTSPGHALFLAREDFEVLAAEHPPIAQFTARLARERLEAIESTLSAQDLAEVP